ncbi:hypothetical protein MuHV1_gp001 [Murid betaherpesvirus 1]|uniref:M01 protein n=1 Tax=Murid herpesvirus 1 (strain K181) TaxID=69156 RepID=A8E1I2_MUHVK|nr:hypothetical protein MuHV1_gp001 [Murid betaherpesvirus 1]CAP08045.1 m01 protein [Murine cytomegalovirus (strain K181)]AQQ81290.1 m01 protein [Murid betaherpesvirus 1]CAJ1013221.1 m01 protein [Murid betaherpesvirus 1]CAJ1013389.1 m01 protein [Murid betaherpesvirus 1]DBA07464.1 TPA_asm: m01 [Murid betaherpesvirus 1]
MKRIGLERCFLSTSYRSTRFPSTALPRLTAERRSTFFTPDPKPRGGGCPANTPRVLYPPPHPGVRRAVKRLLPRNIRRRSRNARFTALRAGRRSSRKLHTLAGRLTPPSRGRGARPGG